ncbi:MAG TPA: luciferase family protein [Steroidobacteraceae bacterium]|nr:luciferase family protein [Steroidobacteraceae bacterium]
MNELRRKLTNELLKIPGVIQKTPPDRNDGFSSFSYNNKDFAHFHSNNDNEIDVRLGKQIIKSQKVPRPADSEVHPDRAAGSPWIELRYHNQKDVAEVIRLIKLALAEF